ncbi:hypothetical protein H2200_002740 [Cladophialophora chaetospira]|uniref:Uncharacterized protein n=1 Tax=Cladophialophora chaetospira TaxID=386627 RepID=A0AA39CNV4_9EURO|nr:hypothetical protein H2200_002740 [Cladophialophora chaetospira]
MRDKRVLIVGSGLIAQRLAFSFSQKFDTHIHDGSTARSDRNGGLKRMGPADPCKYTHVIFATSTDDDACDQVRVLQEKVDSWRRILRTKKECTIILASPTLEGGKVGLTRRVLECFHASGWKVGVAPQFKVSNGGQGLIDPLPKVLAGINDESRAAIRDLYGELYGFKNVKALRAGHLEGVEVVHSHEMLLGLLQISTTRPGSADEEHLVDTFQAMAIEAKERVGTTAPGVPIASQTASVPWSEEGTEPHDCEMSG